MRCLFSRAPVAFSLGSFIALVVVVLVGCSEGGVSPRFDFKVGDAPLTTCGPANCSGCCLGTICTEGNALSACGGGGLACVECTSGMICQTGRCVPSASGCSSANCKGCCSNDTCRSGVGNDACGQAGGTCIDCAATGGVCSAANRTCLASCGPTCTGKCKGADDGCGGKCQVNDCRGCCVGEQCAPGIANAACGKDGSECSDCTKTAGSSCDKNACTSCTPDCAGKCPGAADQCGGTCKTTDCKGCCVGYVCEVGTADNACGATGAACADCAKGATQCKSGSCGSSCVPDCKGKCQGASDTCGGTCSTNLCTGCCESSNCLPGVSDTACGQSGAACAVCPTDFQGYKWKCDKQVCVKGTPTGGGNCTGKTGGTAACTNNTKPGKCWEDQCCTGCWDKNFTPNRCWNYLNSYDDSCGVGGADCSDCTATGKICKNFKCEAPAGPCAGKKELDNCTDGGKAGQCVGGSCCTGCYYYDTGTAKCQVTPDKAKCGKDGGQCAACKAFEFCDSALGSCDTDPGAKFKVIASHASIIDLPGKTWDTIGSAPPDPYLGIIWGTTGCSVTSLSKCTGQVSNDFTPSWQFDLGTYPVSKLKGKHCMYVIDADGPFACAPPFETIGECQVEFTAADFRKGFKYQWDCPNKSDGTDYIVFVLYDLIHVP